MKQTSEKKNIVTNFHKKKLVLKWVMFACGKLSGEKDNKLAQILFFHRPTATTTVVPAGCELFMLKEKSGRWKNKENRETVNFFVGLHLLTPEFLLNEPGLRGKTLSD